MENQHVQVKDEKIQRQKNKTTKLFNYNKNLIQVVNQPLPAPGSQQHPTPAGLRHVS